MFKNLTCGFTSGKGTESMMGSSRPPLGLYNRKAVFLYVEKKHCGLHQVVSLSMIYPYTRALLQRGILSGYPHKESIGPSWRYWRAHESVRSVSH